jgi:phosphatidylserine/phosphatidylglycerophosphate/cardiolipin synthase-like enzyme
VDDTERAVRLGLVVDGDHYERVVRAVCGASLSVWIATANLKQLMVDAAPGRRWTSVLDVFDGLAARGVELRVLHASRPSSPFRERLEALPRLAAGALELRACPRVHLKAVVVDAALLYLGSANWTGAGLGAKGDGRRNFEMGILTRDELLIDEVQSRFDRIWSGAACGGCRLRDVCERPLDTKFEQGGRPP